MQQLWSGSQHHLEYLFPLKFGISMILGHDMMRILRSDQVDVTSVAVLNWILVFQLTIFWYETKIFVFVSKQLTLHSNRKSDSIKETPSRSKGNEANQQGQIGAGREQPFTHKMLMRNQNVFGKAVVGVMSEISQNEELEQDTDGADSISD